MDNLSIERLSEIIKKKYRSFQISKASIGLIITDNCPVGCKHCISDNKANTEPEIELSILYSRIDKIAAFDSFKLVTITGGEPFYAFEKLNKIIAYITKKNLKTSVVTSAYWATSIEKTRRLINKLKDAGIYAITISADLYHQEKIPVSNIANVVDACNDLDIISSIAFTKSIHEKADKLLIKKIKESLSDQSDESFHLMQGGMLNSGRALVNNIFNKKLVESNKDNSLICQSIGKIIRADGKLAVCCGADLPDDSPFIIGNTDNETVVTLQKKIADNYLVPFIETFGLVQMIEMLKKAHFTIDIDTNEMHPANICNLCIKLFSDKKNNIFFREQKKIAEIEKSIAGKYLLYYGHNYPDKIASY
jgi:organic radical activating enzyme